MVVRRASHPPKTRPNPEFYLNSSDETLMQAFHAGDALAFHALIERHTGMLWKIARQYFGARAEIDDLIQDLTLALWQNKSAWQPGAAKFGTWLYKVASNRCIDLLRKREILSHDGILPDHLRSGEQTAEDAISHRQLAQQMKVLLDELPVNQKMALTYYYYEDADLPQIADYLSVSEQAARSLLKRGKQKLRTLLESA